MSRGRRLLRLVSLALTVALVGVWVQFLRPVSLGGPASYVIVSGGSMEPTLHTGDFVFAMKQDTYATGDIVVYRVPNADPGAGTLIVHRIVGGSARTGFVIQGDNREGRDRWTPKPDEIVGKMNWSMPGAGSAMFSVRTVLQTPLGVAALAGLVTLLVGVGAFSRPAPRP